MAFEKLEYSHSSSVIAIFAARRPHHPRKFPPSIDAQRCTEEGTCIRCYNDENIIVKSHIEKNRALTFNRHHDSHCPLPIHYHSNPLLVASSQYYADGEVGIAELQLMLLVSCEWKMTRRK